MYGTIVCALLAESTSATTAIVNATAIGGNDGANWAPPYDNYELVVTLMMVSAMLKTGRKFAGLQFSPSFLEMGAITLSVLVVLLRFDWATSSPPLGVALAFYFNSRLETVSVSRSGSYGFRFMALFMTAFWDPDKFTYTLVSFCVMLTQ